MKKASHQYTIRSVPASVDAVLREKARRQHKSLNQVALEALSGGAGVQAEERYDDLDGFFGSWIADKTVDQALADQRRIDEGIWS